jgi:hypothetical protein
MKIINKKVENYKMTNNWMRIVENEFLKFFNIFLNTIKIRDQHRVTINNSLTTIDHL